MLLFSTGSSWLSASFVHFILHFYNFDKPHTPVLDGAASFRLLLQTVHISKDHLRCLLENMSIDRDLGSLNRDVQLYSIYTRHPCIFRYPDFCQILKYRWHRLHPFPSSGVWFTLHRCWWASSKTVDLPAWQKLRAWQGTGPRDDLKHLDVARGISRHEDPWRSRESLKLKHLKRSRFSISLQHFWWPVMPWFRMIHSDSQSLSCLTGGCLETANSCEAVKAMLLDPWTAEDWQTVFKTLETLD